MWFYGSAVWKKYKEGEAPNAYYILNKRVPIPLDASNVEKSPFLTVETGKPIDISSMVDFPGNRNQKCGELLAGYGLGTTSQEAYDEMLSQKRFDVVFDTMVGPKHKTYRLELKSISTYNSPPFVGTHICSRIRCL